MLILGVKDGESVRLIDTATNTEIGIVKRIKPRRSDPNEILLGFDFDQNIHIVRNNLIGRDATNVN